MDGGLIGNGGRKLGDREGLVGVDERIGFQCRYPFLFFFGELPPTLLGTKLQVNYLYYRFSVDGVIRHYRLNVFLVGC